MLTISETVQDRHTVTTDHKHKMVCDLLNSAIVAASDLDWPSR